MHRVWQAMHALTDHEYVARCTINAYAGVDAAYARTHACCFVNEFADYSAAHTASKGSSAPHFHNFTPPHLFPTSSQPSDRLPCSWKSVLNVPPISNFHTSTLPYQPHHRQQVYHHVQKKKCCRQVMWSREVGRIPPEHAF